MRRVRRAKVDYAPGELLPINRYARRGEWHCVLMLLAQAGTTIGSDDFHNRSPGVTTMKLKISVGLASLLACASFAHAQDSHIDRSFTSTANDCSSITWSERSLEMYPNIAAACQSVETRDGKKFVKFEGTVKKNENRGERLAVNFKDGGVMTLTPPPETNLYIDGKATPVANLRPGDKLKFYIAEDRLAAQFPETETQTAHLVVVPIQVEHHEQMAAALPHTGNFLPSAGVMGLALLMLAAGLAFRRKMLD